MASGPEAQITIPSLPTSGPLPDFQTLGLADDVEPESYDKRAVLSSTRAKLTTPSAVPISSLHKLFPGLEKQYHVLRVIGTGTFSSVFKAIDLNYLKFDNSLWDHSPCKRYNTRATSSEPKFVAIKQLYATASPERIQREIDTLMSVRATGCKQALSIITGIRHEDQILIVLPYAQHSDFRDFFIGYPLTDVAAYLRDLLLACEAIHNIGLIHRDIKPGNFCWNPYTKKGVLVDFGLAQVIHCLKSIFMHLHDKWSSEPHLDPDQTPCFCMRDNSSPDFYKKENIQWIHDTQMHSVSWGVSRSDRRPQKRAERAGTRGFRAPEVLLRCSNQTVGLDVWSCGMILLCFLTQTFPFFAAEDDTDAFLELTNIFGIEDMTICAARHRCIVDIELANITRTRLSWHHLVKSLNPGQMLPGEHPILSIDDIARCNAAFDFLDRSLDLDPLTRHTAGELLEHPFLNI